MRRGAAVASGNGTMPKGSVSNPLHTAILLSTFAHPECAMHNMNYIYIIYPDERFVSDDVIDMWYADAVCNGDCRSGAITIQERADALDDAGIITQGKPPL